MSRLLIYIYILWHLQSLPRLLMWSSGCHGGCSALRVSHFQCLKAWLEGQLKVDAMMFDLRVANGCVDVAERDYCRRLLTVTLLMTRGSTTKLKLWHHYRKNSPNHPHALTEVSLIRNYVNLPLSSLCKCKIYSIWFGICCLYYPTLITVTQWFISKKKRWSDLFSTRLAPPVCRLNFLDGKKEGMFLALGICGINHVPFFWKPPQGLVVFPWIQKIMASQAGCCTPQADWSQSCQRHHSHHSPAFLDPLPLIPSIPAEWKTARVCPNGKYRIFGWSDGYWHGTAVSSRCAKALIHRPFSSEVVTSALPLKEKGGRASMFTPLIHSKHRKVSPTAENPQRKTEQGQSQDLAGSYCVRWEIEKAASVFALMKLVTPPLPESDTFTTQGIYALRGSEVPVQYEEDRFDSKYILAIYPRRFIYRQCSQLKLMLFCSICGGTEMAGSDSTGPLGNIEIVLALVWDHSHKIIGIAFFF